MDIFDIALAKQLAGGGGQPLYRHTINVYEANRDTYEILFEIISTDKEPINTQDALKSLLDSKFVTNTDMLLCVGLFAADGEQWQPTNITKEGTGEYIIVTCPMLVGSHTLLFSDGYSLDIKDTVTEIGTASVSGGGDCQIVDLGQLNGHGDSGEGYAQSTILELLKPTSVPNGKYLYTYYLTDECDRQDATIAICHKSDEKIECVQITSGAEYRRFWYNFADDASSAECFCPLGGYRTYQHRIKISYSDKDAMVEGQIYWNVFSTDESELTDYTYILGKITDNDLVNGYHKEADKFYPIVKLHKGAAVFYVCPIYSDSVGEFTISESIIDEISDSVECINH